jgi:hypothetical protein
MRTATVIMMATLTLAFSPLVGGEKRASRQGQETHRSLPASESWPEQRAERKLYRGEHALVYARKKATADQALKVLRGVAEEAKRDGATKPAIGLIVVIDAREKFPIELAKLTAILNDPNTRADDERSKEILNALREARKLSDRTATDMNSLVAVLPIPLRPTALPKISKEFPGGLARETAWCMIVPTDKYVDSSLTAMMGAVVKTDNMSWKERLLIGAMMPLAQRKGEAEMRKIRRADLYQLLIQGQKDWSEELRKEKVRAYRQKLGLDDSQPQTDPQEKEQEPDGESDSG